MLRVLHLRHPQNSLVRYLTYHRKIYIIDRIDYISDLFCYLCVVMVVKMVAKVLRVVALTVVLGVLSAGDAMSATPFSINNIGDMTLSSSDENKEEIKVKRKGERRNWWEENQTYSTRFRAKQLIAPISFIGVGALSVGEKAPLRGVNLAVRDGLYNLSEGSKLHFDDYIQYAPVAFYLTLDYMGLEAKHSFGERVAVSAVTYLAVTAFSNSVKRIVREPRPDTGARNSFPSGHTMTAFAGAELVRSEYGWGVGMGAYAVAATVGFLRLYNNRHWLNDVVAGAGFGILSARIGYWMLPLNRHIFRIPRKGQALVAGPIYYSDMRAAGLSCAVQF